MKCITALTLVAFLGCSDAPVEEGRIAGSCRDGADNDGDGRFDCADDGCASSPDCGSDGGPFGDAAVLDAAIPDDIGIGCGSRCGPDAHWNPYDGACQIDPSIDVEGAPICGCDGVTYPGAGYASRRGVRDSVQGACGDTLTPCGDRECTSQERCDSVDCDPSTFTCLARPISCEAPVPENEVCGCDGEWYADSCHLRKDGNAGLSFDDALCAPRSYTHYALCTSDRLGHSLGNLFRFALTLQEEPERPNGSSAASIWFTPLARSADTLSSEFVVGTTTFIDDRSFSGSLNAMTGDITIPAAASPDSAEHRFLDTTFLALSPSRDDFCGKIVQDDSAGTDLQCQFFRAGEDSPLTVPPLERFNFTNCRGRFTWSDVTD